MKPILMNTEEVKAILANRKTVTRRLIKSAMLDWSFVELQTNPYQTRIRKDGEMYPHKVNGLYAVFDEDYSIDFPMVKAPYQPGDVLYVLETWQLIHDLDGNEQIIEGTERYIYAADNLSYADLYLTQEEKYTDHVCWRSSIHMPKEAARIFLRVTDVRVERLQDISLYDVWDEGTPQMPGNDDIDGAVGHEDWAYLWNSAIKKSDLDKYGWDANPWVWVMEFERISKEGVNQNDN